MPHKHTRKGEDKSTIDLPPTVIAKPLSTSKSASANGIFTSEVTASRKSKKRKRNGDTTDDTPRAFARLMAFRDGKKLPKGLDDGVKPTKKQKKEAAHAKKVKDVAETVITMVETPKVEMPTIRIGEKMSDFSARVDAALPVAGLINKTARGGKDPLGLKVVRTKKEKKMHKMYDEWREQDKKIQEQREEALELAEEEEDDEELGVKWKVDMEAEASNKKSKKKGKKRKKMIGEIADAADDDDPWKVLKQKRGEVKIGLHDVAQAPPTFKNIPREVFKVRGARVNVADVPKTAGSLRRREELGEVRKSFVEGYRQLMKEKAATRDAEKGDSP